jgi:hypothetical protein
LESHQGVAATLGFASKPVSLSLPIATALQALNEKSGK